MEHLVHLREKDNVLSLPTCSTVTGVSIRVWLPRGLKVAANKTSPDLQPCQGGFVLLCEQIPLTQGSTCRGVHWSKSCFRSAILRTSMKVLPSRSSWRKSFKIIGFNIHLPQVSVIHFQKEILWSGFIHHQICSEVPDWVLRNTLKKLFR